MLPEPGGFHSVVDCSGRPGDRYKLRLDTGESFPDPASRAQFDSVHGPSLVVDPAAFAWSDQAWRRPPFRDIVIYEIHVGTFTAEGTFRAAIDKLPLLRELGVNAIELMPIADFPGSRNWGYDGVLIYAPARAYGSPDDLRALVDAAHAAGIAVILDVVYNHFGPDGNYVARFSRHFFTERHHTPWGAAFNFDGEMSRQVRAFFVQNPIYWMEQFHIDGFRFDATHAIRDDSKLHILAELTRVIHDRGGYAIAEDERNEAQLLRAVEEGGFGFDGVWADDFHHTIRVGQTGESSSYFRYFRGTTEELVETLQHGWLYRGDREGFGDERRGTECRNLPPSRFVICLSNHDQAGNRAFGERLNAAVSPAGYRALSMLVCLTPYTPMLFMGQEWAASTPFQFFTEHNAELGALITAGRRREFAGFPEFSDPKMLVKIPDPQDAETFRRSKLDWTERNESPHALVLALYAACLAERHALAALRPVGRDGWEVGMLGGGLGALRLDGEGGPFLLVFDLAGGHRGELGAETISSLGAGETWTLHLSSNEARFGGSGRAGFDQETQRCDFPEPEVVFLRAIQTNPTPIA